MEQSARRASDPPRRLRRSRALAAHGLLPAPARDPPPLRARAVEHGRRRRRRHQLVRDARERPVATGPARLPRRLSRLRDAGGGVPRTRGQPVSAVLRGQQDGGVPDRPRDRRARATEPLEDAVSSLPRAPCRAPGRCLPRRSHRLDQHRRRRSRRRGRDVAVVLDPRPRQSVTRAAGHRSVERRLRRPGRRLSLPPHRPLPVHGPEGAPRRPRSARGLRARAGARERRRPPALPADGAAAAAARVPAHRLAHPLDDRRAFLRLSPTGSRRSRSAVHRGRSRGSCPRTSATGRM